MAAPLESLASHAVASYDLWPFHFTTSSGMRPSLTLLAPFALLTFTSTLGNAQRAVTDSSIVRFAGRTVNAAALLNSARYANWTPIDDAGLLFYTDAPAPGDAGSVRDPMRIYVLRMAKPGQRADLLTGRPLTDVAWSDRQIRSLDYLPASRALVIHTSGTRADPGERMFRVPIDGGRSVLLTTDTLTDAVLDRRTQRLAYVSSRPGAAAQYCLRLVDITTASLIREMCEGPDGASLRPALLVRSPDGRGVALPIIEKGRPQSGNAMAIDLFADPNATARILLPADSARRMNLNEWIAPGVVRIWERQGNRSVLHDVDLQSGTSTPVVESPVSQPAIGRWEIRSRGREVVVTLHQSRDSVGNAVRVRDAASGRTLGEWFSRNPLASHAPRSDTTSGRGQGVRFIAMYASPTRGRWADDLRISIDADRATFRTAPLLHSEIVEQTAERCRVRRVTIPTWDIDSTTGANRLLSGYLFEPIQPVRLGGRRVAVIYTYYGGGESHESIYSARALAHCALGVTYLSPAVRDVRGAGDNIFSSLAVADPMVGDVRDVVYSARFLERELGLRSEEIGLWGGSRGAGVLLRALTALKEARGFQESERYRFAFGVTQAGGGALTDRTDRPAFQRYWTKLLRDTAAISDRNPFRHIDALEVPVLFMRGTEDPGSTIDAIRAFEKEARSRGLPIESVEFEGEGHNFATLRGNIGLLRAEFEFLERVLARKRGALREPVNSATVGK